MTGAENASNLGTHQNPAIFQQSFAEQNFLRFLQELPSHARIYIGGVKWLTWSASARRLLSRFGEETNQLPQPKHTRLLGGLEFDHTYSIPMADIQRLNCFSKLEQMAMGLRSQHPEHELILFRGLLDDKFNGEHLHKLFACLREILAESTGQVLGALYAPLSYVGRNAGDFPLHADLYVPDLLWNVFDRVPIDSSGMVTLLPAATFRALLTEAQTPPAEGNLLLSYLEDASLDDRFRSFYDLLYVNGADWTDRLTALMRQRQFRLPLGYGQGYLINDRKWLHGREAPTGGVTTKRVHRLVFLGL